MSGIDNPKEICSYEKCLVCRHKECWTGQIAREHGEEAYINFLKELDECYLQESLEREGTELEDEPIKRLAGFVVEEKCYIIYGTYVIEKGTCCNLDGSRGFYGYPEFYDLIAKHVEDGIETDFEPEGVSCNGHKYDVADMIQDFLAKQIQHSTLYTAVYLEEGLQNLVDSYHKDIVITVNDLDIPKRILSNDMYNLFELELVTSEYIYYVCENICLMLSTDSHRVVSDNYFAEVGFHQSVQNIVAGRNEEILLWGKLPED